MTIKFYRNILLLILILFVFTVHGFCGDLQDSKSAKGTIKKSSAVQKTTGGKVGDAFLFDINNVQMPMDNKGIVANVNVGGVDHGRFQRKNFLWSGGFLLSGRAIDSATGRATKWANGVASASRIGDYLPGRFNPVFGDDPQIYVVSGKDHDFGEAWQTWKDAVKLGADFYDGDGDGIYNPVDLNNNGKWDPTEDRPDMIGDQVAWCIYSDTRVSSARRFTEEIPRGIEIQQSLFGYQSAGLLGNMLFLRYRITNKNQNVRLMDSVFFAVWADPDLGDAYDDLVGCDTTRNGGFTYNNGADAEWGSNPPCFFIDFFQGPIVYVPGETFTDVDTNGVFNAGDIPLDTAYNVQGQIKGVKVFPGAKNLKLHSFINYVQSDPNRGDPSDVTQAYNYTRGLLKLGTKLDPCTDTYGTVYGMPCTDVSNRFWYAGNVATNTGWIYTTPGDVRQMQNIGPFNLERDKPVDVVVAYIVGRGSSAKTSVVEAQKISDFAQFVYDRNFKAPPPPPAVVPTVRTTENSIDLFWNTNTQVNYRNIVYADPPANTVKAWDMKFQGYEVWMYRTNSTAPTEGGLENAKLIARYDIADMMEDILVENALSGERVTVYYKGTQLDTNIYKDPIRGRIGLRISSDPYTNGPLIKGKPYYFAITAYALNTEGLEPVDPLKLPGNYLITSKAFVGSSATLPTIINGGIRPGSDFNDPYAVEAPVPPKSGLIGDVNISYNEILKIDLTGDAYKINFFKKTDTTKYFMFWRLTNTTKNTILLDSQKVYNAAKDSFCQKLYDGFLVNVDKYDPAIGTPTYKGKAWYRSFTGSDRLGVYYLGSDLNVNKRPAAAIPAGATTITKAERLRQVEIRFGEKQKAYRYIFRTSIGGWQYAAAEGLPGFVDVPFQVWVNDPRYGEQRQLTCAFLEVAGTGGSANGVWDPKINIDATREYIVIFDRPYSNDSLTVYTGGRYNNVTTWAKLASWIKPAAWPSSVMSTADSIIARSSYFDGLYAVGFARDTARIDSVTLDTLFYKAGDVFTIPVARYPIMPSDEFVFSTRKKGEGLNEAERKVAFNRVTVYPNPLFAYNPLGSYAGKRADDSFVTFSNLPNDVQIRIFSLSGSLIRTLSTADKESPSSPLLDWNLLNQDGLRVASGMYIAIVSSPGLGEKILKFAIIMPQKQIPRF